MGSITLPTSDGRPTEGCLVMESSKAKGQPVFNNLGVIRFTRLDDTGAGDQTSVGIAAVASGPDTPVKQPGSQNDSSPVATAQLSGTEFVPMATPAPGLDLEGEYGWLTRPPFERALGRRKTFDGSAVGQITAVSSRHSQMHRGGSARSEAFIRQAAASNNSSKGAATAVHGVKGNSHRTHHAATNTVKHHRSRSRWALQHRLASSQIDVDALHPHLNATPAMKQVERDAIAAAAKAQQWRVGSQRGERDKWQDLRLRHNWPDGQHKLESMYSPYHAEGIEMCRECLPEL